MKLIPAIDLMDGKCVRLLRGDFNISKQFSNNPASQAKLWEGKGATALHIVDLDAARTGNFFNDQSIISIRESINIPIQMGGGIRSEKRIKQLFSYGVDKVIIGTSAIEDRKFVEDLTYKFPGQIIIGIDAKNGKVSTRGWLKQSDILAIDLIKDFANFDISSFIVTDIETDGTLNGPNENFIREVLENSNHPVIASGGVGSLSDLVALTKFESFGLVGVIVGKALYENKFTIKEGNDVLCKERMTDISNEKDYFA
tara:strand:- start:4935 stop:5702 length:768 start_codon:yes stop_codon:yes gene_type:complete